MVFIQGTVMSHLSKNTCYVVIYLHNIKWNVGCIYFFNELAL